MRSLHRGLLFGRGLTSGLTSASAWFAARVRLKAMLLELTMASQASIRMFLQMSRTHTQCFRRTVTRRMRSLRSKAKQAAVPECSRARAHAKLNSRGGCEALKRKHA